MWNAIAAAGPVGYVLLGISVLSGGVIVERLLFWLGRALRGNRLGPALRTKVLAAFKNGAYERVDDMLASNRSVQADALRYVRQHCEAGDDGPVDVAVSREMRATDRWLLILDVNGSIAPMLGILGTVLGIIQAFRGMTGGQPDTSTMVSGISQSMLTTAIGLIVALISIIPYNVLASRAHHSQTDLAELLQECWMARPGRRPQPLSVPTSPSESKMSPAAPPAPTLDADEDRNEENRG